MTVIKTPYSDVTSDAFIEVQTVTLSSGSVTVDFEAPFTEKPTVICTGIEEGTTVNAEIDEGSTYDSNEVTIVGDDDVSVNVLIIGK